MKRRPTGYAVGTTVDPSKSQAEIVTLLKKHGATQHLFGEDERGAVVGFAVRGRQIRFTIPYPTKDPIGRDAEIRRRWRCLLISIKAKFENVAVAESVSPEQAANVFRAEFLAETVLSDGRTVAEIVLPMVERNYAGGGPPRLLLPGVPADDGP
jgi:hypothetical protein